MVTYQKTGNKPILELQRQMMLGFNDAPTHERQKMYLRTCAQSD